MLQLNTKTKLFIIDSDLTSLTLGVIILMKLMQLRSTHWTLVVNGQMEKTQE